MDDTTVERWRAEGRLVVHCPEISGGLPVPRPPAEIEPGADAADVLAGCARILTPEGADVTAHFVFGARAAVATALEHGVAVALLQQSSPSCGSRDMYDGTFAGHKVAGEGVTAHLLRAHGIPVLDEGRVAEAARLLAEAESTATRAAPEDQGLTTS
ncbi:DUF523 domain-containing protein [Nocardiopsis sp. MG754419]|uniref:DUF523 domain-containing protein n=1 Tax=Nocardiopsis sp. MG754419 TaxID=2259865 RepID=UPI0027DB6F39|nr:DUF523 domain-containing protein [Nocardiopsis sp. MG754419]